MNKKSNRGTDPVRIEIPTVGACNPSNPPKTHTPRRRCEESVATDDAAIQDLVRRLVKDGEDPRLLHCGSQRRRAGWFEGLRN